MGDLYLALTHFRQKSQFSNADPWTAWYTVHLVCVSSSSWILIRVKTVLFLVEAGQSQIQICHF